MKAEVNDMKGLLSKGSREEIIDYLANHTNDSRDTAELRIKLMKKELKLRGQ